MASDSIRFILFLLLGTFCFSQNIEAYAQIHCPRLTYAEVPFYPPVPWGMHFGGVVEIQIKIENGTIRDAQLKRATIEPQDGDKDKYTKAAEDKLLPYLTTPSLNNLKIWRFVPEQQGKFVVTFIYRLEGEETLEPETPKVELELPIIRVTARPFKPTRS